MDSTNHVWWNTEDGQYVRTTLVDHRFHKSGHRTLLSPVGKDVKLTAILIGTPGLDYVVTHHVSFAEGNSETKYVGLRDLPPGPFIDNIGTIYHDPEGSAKCIWVDPVTEEVRTGLVQS